jgi:hypothetical protein
MIAAGRRGLKEWRGERLIRCLVPECEGISQADLSFREAQTPSLRCDRSDLEVSPSPSCMRPL